MPVPMKMHFRGKAHPQELQALASSRWSLDRVPFSWFVVTLQVMGVAKSLVCLTLLCERRRAVESLLVRQLPDALFKSIITEKPFLPDSGLVLAELRLELV